MSRLEVSVTLIDNGPFLTYSLFPNRQDTLRSALGKICVQNIQEDQL